MIRNCFFVVARTKFAVPRLFKKNTFPLLARNYGTQKKKQIIDVIPDKKLQETLVPDKKVEETLEKKISNDVGLQQFLQRVYTTAGGGVFATLSLPIAVGLTVPVVEPYTALGVTFTGFFVAMAGCFGLHRFPYTVNEEKTRSENSLPRQLSFFSIIGGMSIMLTPFSQMIFEIDPTIWPKALVLSVGTTAAATLWATTRPVDELLSWRGPLNVGLVVLLTNGIAMLGVQFFFPSSGLGDLMQWVDIGGGIVLFTAMTAYETHAAVAMYRDGDPDHLGCATQVYLDFINILIRIAEAFAKAKRND